MKKLILLNGSPQGQASTSAKLLELCKSCIGDTINVDAVETTKSILQKKQLNDYSIMEDADVIVIAFPLYIYCLPGVLDEFLVGYKEYLQNKANMKKQKVYAIINCGFPEAHINKDAALVIKSFCKEIEAEYCFSILIGGGGMLKPLRFLPSVNRQWKEINLAFKQIMGDMEQKTEISDIHIDSKTSKKLFSFIAETNFAVIAKKKGINKKELFKQPYIRKVAEH